MYLNTFILSWQGFESLILFLKLPYFLFAIFRGEHIHIALESLPQKAYSVHDRLIIPTQIIGVALTKVMYC